MELAPGVAFGEADFSTMAPVALVAAFSSFNDKTPKELVHRAATILTKRLLTEKIDLVDSMKFKLLDKIVALAPHVVIQPLKNLAGARRGPNPHLVVIVDTSGSMSSCIAAYQTALKSWIQDRLGQGAYTGLSLLFFASTTNGPFHDVSCLDHKQPSGQTFAEPALKAAMQELTRFGASDVIFMTDGEFNDHDAVYRVGQMPNVLRFTMLFPNHTPQSAVDDHYSYLPRITPPGIAIGASNTQSAADVAVVLDRQLSGSASQFETKFFSLIACEYAMLNRLTIYHMNKLVEDLLSYGPESYHIVHNFFSHVMGMFNAMMLRGGDLLNTLRSPEMRLMWSFLQPLKKRFSAVSEQHVHYPTVVMVLEFLEAFEGQLVEKRDKRIAELKKMKPSNLVTDELAEIRKAFNDMKKVDDFDRILTELKRLMSSGARTAFVKFHYQARIPLELFRIFPNIPIDDALEIYKMVDSLYPCAAGDADALEVPMDARGQGLLLAMRTMTYRKDDDTKMTLTATQATRILYGFFVQQMVPYSLPLIGCRAMLWKLCATEHSYTILANVTNLQEPNNNAPEWTRILYGMSAYAAIRVPVDKMGTDKTLWVASPNNDAAAMTLNMPLLERMVSIQSAVRAFKMIHRLGSSELAAQVTTMVSIPNVPFGDLILVKLEVEQSAQAWMSEVIGHKNVYWNTGFIRIPITNGMVLQERLNCAVEPFVLRNWDRGHRLICKSGAAHPATKFGNSYERPVVEQWLRDAWAAWKLARHYESQSLLPVVPNQQRHADLVAFLKERAADPATLIEYPRSRSVPLKVEAVARHLPLSASVKSIVNHLASLDGFAKLSTDEQQTVAFEQCLNVDRTGTYTEVLPEELEAKATKLAADLAPRFAPMRLADGVALTPPPRRARTLTEWTELGIAVGESLQLLTELNLFDPNDFYCPITGEIFEDPVAFGGHFYESDALKQWLSLDPRRSSPLTRQTADEQGNALTVAAPPPLFVSELARFKASQRATCPPAE